ncbi:T9SS outer membrane translocon Sov/SprA [Winogradskyella aurantiaca]|uniref:T9SS outer membrane translocon Sov/SprA n=1 Tax=Winogradskyella aurantiaca TaxID=2219558 RepID=UPI000E1D3CF3|nr:cell surface protein SprA [Winogradskyella aurantiaca]
MSTTNTTNSYNFKVRFLFIALFLLALAGNAQQENNAAQDTTKTGFSLGPVKFANPNSIVKKYTYDPILDRYIYTEQIGNFNINYPLILTPAEFERLVLQESMRDYYQQKIDAQAGQKEGSEEAQKNLLPDFYVNSGFFETIFGSDVISIVPQGSVEVDLGVLYSRQDNPNFSPRNRRNFTFDFDQRISVSLLGKIGTRLQITANYDTQSTFDFQNLIKLEYTPTEDDIVQKIEVGNVNMPLNSTLITGAQALFGVKTKLQFGKTTVTAVFSEQQSQSRQVVAQGGGTLEEFEFFGRDYDENRHFFLAQFFRENYDKALLTYPYPQNDGIQITRVEVWVTNRNNQTQNVRNIVALQDIGESDVIGLPNPPPDFVNVPQGSYPDNGNNKFNPQAIGEPGNLLTKDVRDITNVEAGILVPVNEGFDYGKIETARKLNQGSDYILNSELGYISLNQRLLNDEVLAVAFQYTRNGEVFQVGEFANDGIDASGIDEGDGTQNPEVANNSLVLKMLKSAVTVVDQPVWDLMMKNIYDTGAFNLDQEDFRLNIFYTEASPVNYITPVDGSMFPIFDNNTPFDPTDDTEINETPLIRLFHLDKLNFNGDPQSGGDGFFDFVPRTTIIVENGKIIFTKAEPFGEYLFNTLQDPDNPGDYDDVTTYNPNQQKYVYDILYKSTKIAALEEAQKNKFQIKGRFKSSGGGDGIPIGAFNVPRGSVRVTAGGRVLVEGIDYTVNYQLGRVQILDEALKASNTPIEVSVENNAIFGQQTRRFTGINVEHQFNQDFLLGGTFLNLNERPITQKANFDSEPINNSIFGLYGNYATEVPFFTRLVNKLPNVDTDVPSNLSVRGEIASLSPGAPKGTSFNNEATAYIDDFEGTQGTFDLLSPLPWFHSSRPNFEESGITNITGNYQNGVQSGYGRALLNWYTIDPVFYSAQRPSGLSDDDISLPETRRVFINEIFPQVDIAQGNTSVIFTLDMAYYPTERGPYNFDPNAANENPLNPSNSYAGITRQITSTDFEQANVEFIEFWVQDPFINNPGSQGGKLFINLGNISEDVLKDGKKIYENGLPEDGDVSLFNPTDYGTVVPQNQSLVYTFGTTGQERTNQDVGYDGYDDAEEASAFPNFANLIDPSNDNYNYFLNATGGILERYKQYNGLDGNTPDSFTDTNRGSTTQPDVEDINRDNTMNTIDSYFEYEIDINPSDLNINNPQINDIKTNSVTLPNGETEEFTWYQFRLPIAEATRAIGGIQDRRSIRFIRMFMTGFQENTVLRFATFDLVRSDWRRYTLDLDNDDGNNSPNAEFSVGIVGVQQNDGSYVSPPGVVREQLNNNNTIIRQNEQALVVKVCDLIPTDSRGVFKNINLDMRQYKRMRMFMHARPQDGENLEDGQLIGFIRMGNDFTDNFYQIEVPLVTYQSDLIDPSLPIEEQVWPFQNEINLPLEVLQQIKSIGIFDQSLTNDDPTFYDVIDGELVPDAVPEYSPYTIGQQRVAVKGNPNFGDIRVLMLGIKNTRSPAGNACGEIWYNELRMSGLDNEGGYAAVMSLDTNLADFANISATGSKSTAGFGGIEQTPNERSREDIEQYDLVTNWNLGQLLPKEWGVQVPFNFGVGEERITPKFDRYYRDIELQTQLDNPNANRDSILRVNEDYTKRKSINFIGVRKNRTSAKQAQFYDVENFTLNYSHNTIEQRNFELESSLNENIRAGANYNFGFEPIRLEPFQKNDSLFKSRYWKILKDINFNPLPTSFSVNSEIRRQFTRQKFREVELGADNIQVEELFRRNYTFDFQYVINYNLSDNLNFNFTATNNNIVRNYFIDGNIINGRQDPSLDVWDGFFNPGDPNIQNQQFQLNWTLPINKIPYLEFINANYAYTGTFQWTKGSDINLSFIGEDLNGNIREFNLGNTIQNSNLHALNTTFNFDQLYRSIGLVKKTNNRSAGNRSQPGQNQSQSSGGSSIGRKAGNTLIDLVTMVKRGQFTYRENNGTFLPGFVRTPGWLGTTKPSLGFTFGLQDDIRQKAAGNGWLTEYDQFNQQYTTVRNKTFDYSANLEPFQDFKIDVVGNRIYSESNSENFRVDQNIDGSRIYNSLNPNTVGNFAISSAIIATSFSKSNATESTAFDNFSDNRLVIADRLARDFYGNDNFPRDEEGFPVGFGKTNQSVLIPAFYSAYTGANPENVGTSAIKSFAIPNWIVKYTGLMRIPWFRSNFRRFSLQHGYRSSYTINQFRTNLEYSPEQPDEVDQQGNFRNPTLYTNINLEEQFSPLIRVEFEMKNSLKVLLEMQRDRLLSLSLDNNLVTETQGREYIVGLGYRVKDVRIRSSLAGSRQVIRSDLNMRMDIAVRENATIIRYLDVLNSQITAGQTIWSVNYTADYAFSKNLTGIFYFDYTFSDFAISTSFPQANLRAGVTMRYIFGN